PGTRPPRRPPPAGLSISYIRKYENDARGASAVSRPWRGCAGAARSPGAPRRRARRSVLRFCQASHRAATLTESALITDLYQLTMLEAYRKLRFARAAVFELYARRLPPER